MPRKKWEIDHNDCYRQVTRLLKNNPGMTTKQAITTYSEEHGIPFHRVNTSYYGIRRMHADEPEVDEYTKFFDDMTAVGDKVGFNVHSFFGELFPIIKKSIEYDKIKSDYDTLSTEYATMKENVALLNGMLEHFMSLTALEKHTTIGDLVYKMKHTVDKNGMVTSVSKTL